MKTGIPIFATKEWLEKNVLAGNGEVSECQRRTIAWKIADAPDMADVHVKRVFKAASGLHAVVVSGRKYLAKYEALGLVKNYGADLDLMTKVVRDSVSVPLFTCDAATGVWHALVLFRRFV